MLKTKAGVTPDSLILLAAVANVHHTWRLLEKGPKDLVITAGSNGTHKMMSRHGTHQAIDVRSTTFAEDDKLIFLGAVIGRLGTAQAVTTPQGPGFRTKAPEGKAWLGIYEDAGTPHEHFHLERD